MPLTQNTFRAQYQVLKFLDTSFAEATIVSQTASSINIRVGVGQANICDLQFYSPDNNVSFSPGTPMGIRAVSVSLTDSSARATATLFQGYVLNATRNMDANGSTVLNVHCMDRSYPTTVKYPSFNNYYHASSSLNKALKGTSTMSDGSTWVAVGLAAATPGGLLYRTDVAYSGPTNVLPTASQIGGNTAWPTTDSTTHLGMGTWAGQANGIQLTKSGGTALTETQVLTLAPFGRPIIDIWASGSGDGGTSKPVLVIRLVNSITGDTASDERFTFSSTGANAAQSISVTSSAFLTVSHEYRLDMFASGSTSPPAGDVVLRVYSDAPLAGGDTTWQIRTLATFSGDVAKESFNRHTVFQAIQQIGEKLPGEFVFPYDSNTLSFLQDYTRLGKQFQVGTEVERWSIQDPQDSTVQRVIIISTDKQNEIYEYRNPASSSLSAEASDSRTKIIEAPAFKNFQDAYAWAYAQFSHLKSFDRRIEFDINGWVDTTSRIGSLVTLSHLGTNFIGRCTGESHNILPSGLWRKTIQLNGDQETPTQKRIDMEDRLVRSQKDQTAAQFNSSPYLVLIPRAFGSG